MNKFKGQAVWVIKTAVILVVFYFGFIEGVQGAKNIALFLVWLTFLLSLFTLRADFRRAIFREEPRVPRGFRIAVDYVVLAILLWSGAIVTGTAYFLASILVGVAQDTNKKEAEAAKNAREKCTQ